MATAKFIPDLDLLVKNACAQSKTLSEAALALDCELSLYTDLPPAHRLVQAAMRVAFVELATVTPHPAPVEMRGPASGETGPGVQGA